MLETLIGVIDNPMRMKQIANPLIDVGHTLVFGNAEVSVFDLIKTYNPSVLILGIGSIPDLDVLGVTARIREFTSMPIIVFGDDKDSDCIATMLEGGADAYVVKEDDNDFTGHVLVATVEALLRREEFNKKEEDKLFINGELSIDFNNRSVFLQDREIPLTPTEYRILSYLAHNINKNVESGEMVDQVWGYEYDDKAAQMLRANISRLRGKLGESSEKPHFIFPCPKGYLMVDDSGVLEFQVKILLEKIPTG